MVKSLKELRKEAKERGLKGYSTLSKDQLIQLLNGEMIEKKLRKNQKSKETQTEFKQCEECAMSTLLYQLSLKAERNKIKAERRIVEEDNGVIIDIDTGEVLGMTVETSYIS